jgi:VWFA-related protein
VRPKFVAALFACLAFAAVPCLAQQKPPDPPAGDDDEVERVNVHLVNVPVTVTDRDGRFVPDLRAEDFHVSENGVAQRITNFADAEQPFSVMLLLDTSGSTIIRLKDIQDSAIAFVNQLRPQDRVLPVAFDNDTVALLPGWSSDRAALAAAIRNARTGMVMEQRDVQVIRGRDGKPVTLRRVNTRLYDAVHKAAEALRVVRGRKALILFTDGFDNASTLATRKGTLDEAEELDALVYVVQYDRFGDYGVPQQPVAQTAPRAPAGPPPSMTMRTSPTNAAATGISSPAVVTQPSTAPPVQPDAEPMRPFDRRHPKILEVEGYLKSLTERTGGRFFRADRIQSINDSFAAVAEELRRMYSIGYSPNPLARAGERREVKVKVRRDRVSVRARRAYVFKPL